MQRRSSKLSVLVLAIAAPLQVPAAGGGQDGLYSNAQAKLGETIYGKSCMKCHEAAGEARGPALKGDPFWADWDGKTARALYSRIISTMPSDDPGSLPEKDVISLVSYIMQLNSLPGGNKEIQSANELNRILLQRPSK